MMKRLTIYMKINNHLVKTKMNVLITFIRLLMSMDYERILQRSNPLLYNTIKGKIGLMPDFRSMETVKQMRAESQNNWRVLVDVLDAISYREEHIFILEAFNEGRSIDIDEYEVLKEFVISYPGLLWVFWIVSNPLPLPLFISQWKNLPKPLSNLLEGIPLNTEHISYIRDLETASILCERMPSVNEEDLQKIIKKEESKNLIGWTYWYMAKNLFSWEEWDIFMVATARMGNMRLYEEMSDYMKKHGMVLAWMDIMIKEGFDEGLSSSIHDADKSILYHYYIESVGTGNISITRILRNNLPNPVNDLRIREILKSALKSRSLPMVKQVFSDSVFSYYTKYLLYRDIVGLVEEGYDEIIEYLLGFPIPDAVWQELKDSAISRRRSSILIIMLKSKRILLDSSDIQNLAFKNMIEALEEVIKNSDSFSEEYTSILRAAILKGNRSMTKSLWNNPKMNKNKERLEGRYRRMAQELLKE